MPTPPSASPPPGTNALCRGVVHQISGWRRLLFWPAAWGMDLYYRTLRVRFRPEEWSALEAIEGPRLFVIWHNRSLLFPRLLRDVGPERVHCLISASKMAAWEAAYFAHRRFAIIRGSTTRGGAVALKTTLRVLDEGQDFAISPDGPSGPLYEVKKGITLIARRSGATLVLVGANSPRAHRLRSWDRHLVPWPGQSVEGRLRVVRPADEAWPVDDDAAFCARLRTALLEINDE